MSAENQILVVDDSLVIVESLEAILRLSGYKVDTAYSGSEALRKIHQKDYDIVICDIEMPGLDGLEFLSRAKKEFDDDLDVILMTGYLEHDYFISAIRLGASDFIRKPIDSKQLINSIRDLLFRKQERKDFLSIFNNLEKASLEFEISAREFSKFGVSRIFKSAMKHYFRSIPKTMNELLICLDEMAYNAYIHGTLKLSVSERSLSHDKLKAVIDKRLADDEIGKKRVILSITASNEEEYIEIKVSDEGDGFDYKSWLEKVKEEPFLDMVSHGRGLSMLYHLCGLVAFDNGGRTVIVRKSLNSAT
ncbi:MAG: response regulator [Candidatus Cloacimonadaceae bacterium]